jgi:hypothetical protein
MPGQDVTFDFKLDPFGDDTDLAVHMLTSFFQAYSPHSLWYSLSLALNTNVYSGNAPSSGPGSPPLASPYYFPFLHRSVRLGHGGRSLASKVPKSSGLSIHRLSRIAL